MSVGMVDNIDPAYLTAAIGGIAFAILDELMNSKKPNPEKAAQFAAQLVLTGMQGQK